MKTAIGCDIGHSTVKLSFTANGEVRNIIFPSVAVPAFRISNEIEAAKAEKETVSVNGIPYFFGDAAAFQSAGNASSGLTDDWINKPEHTALLLGAFKKLNEAGVDIDDSIISLGLPTNLVRQYKDELKRIVNSLVKPDTVFVMPQSIAPFHTVSYDKDGYEYRSKIGSGSVLDEEAWGVVEVGYYTTDFMLIDKGRWAQKSEGACKGVYVAAERLKETLTSKNINCTLIACEKALRDKTIKNFGTVISVSQEVDESISEIVSMIEDESQRLLKDRARDIEGVLIAGGGAPLVFDKLKAKWPHAVLAENSRFAVSEGMRRYGEYDLRRRGFQPVITK